MLAGECSRVEYQQIMAVHGVVAVSSTLACGLEEDGSRVGGWSFGTLLGPGSTGPGLLHAPGGCAGVGFCFFRLSRAWPRPYELPLCGCSCGGGCDGVVVWELYSGREHLVRQGFFLVLHGNFL